MSEDDLDRQRYFKLLEAKLDAYFHAVLSDAPVAELNADLKGFLEAGMVLKATSKDVLDAMIQARYHLVRNKTNAL